VRALLQDTNLAPDIPGTRLKTRIWGASGMATRIDTAADTLEVAQGGVIYHTPTIRTAAGVAALRTFRTGDLVTLLFTEPTVVEIKPIQ
jgi:dihydroorotate dehydrogenase